MKTVLKCAAALAFAITLSACNTIEGMGKDISTAGKKIEETANDNK